MRDLQNELPIFVCLQMQELRVSSQIGTVSSFRFATSLAYSCSKVLSKTRTRQYLPESFYAGLIISSIIAQQILLLPTLKKNILTKFMSPCIYVHGGIKRKGQSWAIALKEEYIAGSWEVSWLEMSIYNIPDTILHNCTTLQQGFIRKMKYPFMINKIP